MIATGVLFNRWGLTRVGVLTGKSRHCVMAFGGNLCRSSCTYMWWTDRWLEKWVGGFHPIQYRLIVLTTRLDSVVVRLFSALLTEQESSSCRTLPTYSRSTFGSLLLLSDLDPSFLMSLSLSATILWCSCTLLFQVLQITWVTVFTAAASSSTKYGVQPQKSGLLLPKVTHTTSRQQHRGKGKFLQPQPDVKILREARNTI